MNYTYEQIMCYSQYQKICNCFFGLAKDQETRKMLEDILYTGSIGNYTIQSGIPCRDDPTIERQRRISMAYLLVNDPKTFAYLVENDICLFHGTNANALPSIIKYGLNSNSLLQEKGIAINTGEYNQVPIRRSFISFSDLLDLARDYDSLSTKNGDNQLSFGIVLGTDAATIKSARRCPIDSDLPEIGIRDSFSLENIKCALVPKDKQKFVKKMFKNLDIAVLGISNENKKFYYADNNMGFIEIYEDRYEALKRKGQNLPINLAFSS